MASTPDLAGQLHGALKALVLQSAKHPRTQGAIEELATWLHRRLNTRPVIQFSCINGALLLDGVPVKESAAATALAHELDLRSISGLVIEKGVTARELEELLQVLAYRVEGLADLGGAANVLNNRHCPHLQIRMGLHAPSRGPELDFEPMRPHMEAPTQSQLPAQATLPERSAVFLDSEPETQAGLEARVTATVRDRLMGLEREEAVALFLELLDNSFLELLYQVADRILSGLRSPRPGEFEQGMVLLEALMDLEEAPELPSGMGQFLTRGLVDALPSLAAAPRSQTCLDALAAFLSNAWLKGELGPLQAFLVRMNGDAAPAAREIRRRVLSAAAFVQGPLLAVYTEGRATLGPVTSLFKAGGEEVAHTLMRMLGEEPVRQRRNRLLELLKGMGELALPALRNSLSTGPWYLTRNALNLLGDMGDAKAYVGTIQCLEHTDLRVRRAALRTLWRLGGIRAEHLLLDHLQRSDSDTQLEILFGLGQIRATSAIPAIGALASQAPEPLRIKALETLGQIGHASAIPTLAEYLKRHGRIFKSVESPTVRLAAAQSLASIGTPEAVEALTKAVAEAPKNGDQPALRRILEAHAWS